MQIKKIDDRLTVAGQIQATELAAVAKEGFKSIICNRPDGESSDQPTFAEINAVAQRLGLEARHIPVVSGQISASDVAMFGKEMSELPGPVLAFCRSGARSTALRNIHIAAQATYAVGTSAASITAADIVIVGGGSVGIAAAASLLARKADLDIVIIDPAETRYYQPGWTFVGAGIFTAQQTARDLAPVT